jgi:hypothetical protein
MPKEAKKKPAETTRKTAKSSRDGAAAATAAADDAHPIRAFLKAVFTLAFVGFCVYAWLRTRDHVVRDLTFARNPPRVVLHERPSWMSDALMNKIIRVAAPDVAHSAFDHQLLVNTASLLQNHPDTAPWVRTVRSVRRVYDNAPGDTLEIDCDFRSPVALVKWELYYWLVDGDGILLPEQYTAGDLRKVMYDGGGGGDHLSLRIIEGVATSPPESGQKWQGADLAAGIDMIKLLYGKPYADDVERINVANLSGRQNPNEAQVVLITRFQTQVRWGRPVNAKDYFVEVSPAQKLEYMSSIVRDYGRVDAKHSAVDLRFDIVTFPSADAQGEQANTNGASGR